MSPLISGRTDTCSAGPISPAAFTAKLMSRNSTTAVVGRVSAADAGLFFCHLFHAEKPPMPAPTITTKAIHFFISEATHSLNTAQVLRNPLFANKSRSINLISTLDAFEADLFNNIIVPELLLGRGLLGLQAHGPAHRRNRNPAVWSGCPFFVVRLALVA